MKIRKVFIAVFAVMSMASAAKAQVISGNFDGRAGSDLFAQAAAQPVPAATPAALIPARTYPVAFVAGNVDAMNKSIDSAITYARQNRRSPELIAGLECLRKSGSVEQKEAFVYGPATYVLPEICVARPAQPQLKCISSTICSWITETIIRNNCNPNGECMETTVEVLRKTCENLCN